jgi:hypothetical protein
MKFGKTLVPAMVALAAVVLVPQAASAQLRGTPAQQASNARDAAALRARLTEVDARIGVAQGSRAVTHTRASQLRRQLAQTRRSMTNLSRRQGFVSAAESASYTRTLDRITAELDRRGAPRSYGNDVLPSAEMTAFHQTDARLRYRDARIEYDDRNCAVYQGKTRDGRVRREPLLGAGKPICVRR